MTYFSQISIHKVYIDFLANSLSFCYANLNLVTYIFEYVHALFFVRNTVEELDIPKVRVT
jgi:hypothetical protein